VLAWILGEPNGRAVSARLAGEDLILTSEITLIECERALIRAVHGKSMPESGAADRRTTLRLAAAHWSVLPLQAEIADRARQPFPNEPVRALDAIHLATLVVGRALVPGLKALTLDERIRRNAVDLGFEVVPD
jgi:predicted nucleic acid-binding protein